MTKQILRTAMATDLPEKIINRVDKMGFVTPEEVWVKEEKPEEFKKAVGIAVEKSRGVLSSHAITHAKKIIQGEIPYTSWLWRLIHFGTWMDRFSVLPK